jgi:hypothetical protein
VKKRHYFHPTFAITWGEFLIGTLISGIMLGIGWELDSLIVFSKEVIVLWDLGGVKLSENAGQIGTLFSSISYQQQFCLSYD